MGASAGADAAAFFTAMKNHVALFAVRLGAKGTQKTKTGVGAVTGINVNVQGI